jgi:chromosome segregation ATPase
MSSQHARSNSADNSEFQPPQCLQGAGNSGGSINHLSIDSLEASKTHTVATRSQLQNISNLLKDLANKSDTIKANVTVDLDNCDKTIQQLQTTIQQLKKEKETLNENCEDFKGKNDELVGENTRLNDQNDQQHAYIKRLERKLTKHNAALEKFLEDTMSSDDDDSDIEMRQDDVDQVDDLPPFSQTGSHDSTELTGL